MLCCARRQTHPSQGALGRSKQADLSSSLGCSQMTMTIDYRSCFSPYSNCKSVPEEERWVHVASTALGKRTHSPKIEWYGITLRCSTSLRGQRMQAVVESSLLTSSVLSTSPAPCEKIQAARITTQQTRSIQTGSMCKLSARMEAGWKARAWG